MIVAWIAPAKKPKPETVFRVFKYIIYGLLAWNIFLFFQEDLAASAATFGDNVNWRNVVAAYSATIDTGAWVIMLLLFELETAVIPDEKLHGDLKWQCWESAPSATSLLAMRFMAIG